MSLPTDRAFTGQRRDDSTGLHFYNARYYSSALGRFISADTIVPEPGNPQAFNRYSYTYGAPLRYVDPSGHCSEVNGEWDNVLDCSVEQLNRMPWEQRMRWIIRFSKETKVDKFKNIVGILAYFRDDPIFANSAWASLADAAVLFAIEHGYNIYAGNDFTTCGGNSDCANASGKWRDFFSKYYDAGEVAYSLWGKAERAGVDYGTALARPLRNNAGFAEKLQIDLFVSWGNYYRDLISYGSPILGPLRYVPGFGYFDPGSEVSGGFVYLFGHSLSGGARLNLALDMVIYEQLKSFGAPLKPFAPR